MRTLILLTIFVMTLGFSYGQYNPVGRPGYGVRMQQPQQQEFSDSVKGFDPSRLMFGGNFAFTFGDFSFINISPQVGYMISNSFAAGAGINYINTGIKYFNTNGSEAYREKFGYAGMNLFARFFPTNFAFAMIQPEFNYNWGKIKFPDSRPDIKLSSAWVPSFLVGAGANLGGQRGRGMMLSVQYDLAQDPRSPYGNRPFFNMGYVF